MLEASEEVYSSLRRQFKGDLLRPGENGYKDARAIWNGMCARTPGRSRGASMSAMYKAQSEVPAPSGFQQRFVVEGIAWQDSAPAIMAW
jgi:hypothetical protein